MNVTIQTKTYKNKNKHKKQLQTNTISFTNIQKHAHKNTQKYKQIYIQPKTNAYKKHIHELTHKNTHTRTDGQTHIYE